MGKNPATISRTRKIGRKDSCRLEADYLRVACLAHDTALAVRRLRGKVQACQQCGLNTAASGFVLCARLGEFNLLVQHAIQEVLDEWESRA